MKTKQFDNQSRCCGRQLPVLGLVMAALMMFVINPLSANAQLCLHGIGSQMNVFGTNCAGAAVPGFALRGSTIGFVVTANYLDQCGINGNGDRSVVTNITVGSTAVCTPFTSPNLINIANAIPPANLLPGGRVVLDPPPGFSVYQPVNVSSGPFSGASTTRTLPPACTGLVSFVGNVQGFDTNGLSNVGGPLSAQPSANLTVIDPRICVTVVCVTNGFGDASTITWTGTVTNCGDVTLNNVNASLTFLPIGSTNFGPLTLAPGEGRRLTGTYNPLCQTINNVFSASGTDPFLGCTVSAQASAVCTPNCAPQLRVFKQVVCYLTNNTCDAFSPNLNLQKTASGVKTIPDSAANCPAFCYRITVTNAGNVTLTSLAIVDDSVPNPDLNLAACGFPASLAPGATAQCVVSAVSHCANTTNVVTATANGLTSGGSTQTLTARDTNAVVVTPIDVKCAILVSTNGGVNFFKYDSNCATQKVGQAYTIRIVVTNTGSATLQNVVVTSTAGGCPATPTNIGPLAPGATGTIDCTFTCAQAGRLDYAVNVVADAPGCNANSSGGHIRATSSCATCVVCEQQIPRICVTKEVVCETPTGCAPNWSKLAIGTRNGEDCPTFCYRIRVTNCGQEALQNVTVTDTNLSLAGCNFPTTLAVGQTVECIIAGVERCDDLHNVVVAAGTGVGSGIRTNAQDFADVQIREISIVCEATVNGQPFTQIDCDGQPHVVTNAVRVCNTGDLPLSNISIYAPHLVSLGGACADVANLRFSLGVGQCTNIVLCVDAPACEPDCGIAFSNYVKITAHVDLSRTNVCIWTRNASNAVVEVIAETECEAVVGCIQPNACRVTGGGRQDADLLTCPDDVRYVTHGGQVGAPVGERTCTIDTGLPNWILGNPCIHGRWTHVRHQKGGLRGNFHARYYDTLECACLSTNIGPNCQYEPGTFGEPTKKHQVCNPGDKVAGPEPRKSPSNKIVFTGVGDWACPNGRRAPRACLFRVDIEDRSEPGGSHPKGGTDPADRYRIRIWVLTPQELAQLRNPNDGLLTFRNAISACKGIDYLDGGAVSSNGKACIENNCSGDICDGTGATGTITFPGGTPVRTPNIDDGGELERGNHQIHPAIKRCDPYNPTGPGLPGPL